MISESPTKSRSLKEGVNVFGLGCICGLVKMARIQSKAITDQTLHLTGCNATNLAVFPITYPLQPAARSSKIRDLVPVNFKRSLAVDFIVLET